MKKAFAVILAVVIGAVLIGCVDDSAVGTVAIKSGARVAGYSLAKDNPVLAAAVLPQAQTLLAAANGDPEQFVETLFPAAVAMLQKEVGDNALVAASIADVLTLVESGDAPQVTDEKRAELMKTAVQGFSEGIMLAGAETATGK